MAKKWLCTGQASMLIVALLVMIVNIQFRLLESEAVNPVTANSVCFIRGLTPLFFENFDEYCGTG